MPRKKATPKRKQAQDVAIPHIPEEPKPWQRWVGSVADRALFMKQGKIENPFKIRTPPPGTYPKSFKGQKLAMDQQVLQVNAWAANSYYEGGYYGGLGYAGDYAYLSVLAQLPEYRRLVEVLAVEATGKWIKIKSTSDDKTKASKVQEIEAECDRLHVQDVFRKMSELDGFFGRAHLYLDTGATQDREELITSIGNGRDNTTQGKFKGKKNFLRALKPVEPVWVYPTQYDAMDPLTDAWYNPQTWFVQGKEVHRSRLLTFVSREVPDLLKPAYMFGGLSLTQLAKPYVDNWLRTRQAVADLVWSFSVRGLKTNLQLLMQQDGQQLFKRSQMFTALQNNQGLMFLDKDSEDFFNIQTSLGSLDQLQAQAQEHMCSVTGTPVVKLLGIQPNGMNATSEGELTTWYDWVESYQERFFTLHLKQVIDFIMLSKWGYVDDDITFEYEPLRAITPKEEADARKQEADIDVLYLESGVLDPLEVRQRLAEDPESIYSGLDVDKLPQTMAGVGEGEEPEVPDGQEPEANAPEPNIKKAQHPDKVVGKGQQKPSVTVGSPNQLGTHVN